MTTFSQLVDSVILETKRPDLKTEITSYLNQTIREAHFTPDRGNVIHYVDNLQEELLTADVATGFQWAIPNPTRFQAPLAAKYNGVWDRLGNPVWAVQMPPGRTMNDTDWFYYRVAGTFVFSGYGEIGATIAWSWYEYPPSLKYKALADRPAQWDDESGWTYAAGIDTEEEELAAQALVTNWMLMRWKDVLQEGLRAKVYKRLSDDVRGRTCYSLYQTLRQGLFTSEQADLGGWR